MATERSFVLFDNLADPGEEVGGGRMNAVQVAIVGPKIETISRENRSPGDIVSEHPLEEDFSSLGMERPDPALIIVDGDVDRPIRAKHGRVSSHELRLLGPNQIPGVEGELVHVERTRDIDRVVLLIEERP